MTEHNQQIKQTVLACLAWLDNGGHGKFEFDMKDSISRCGTRVCMGGFMAIYAKEVFNADTTFSDGEPALFNVGDWLGLPSDKQDNLFFKWPGGHEHNAASAAERLRAAFPQYAKGE